MARIRTIKPDYWTDEKIVELDPLHRLLFIGMWNFADDQGYLDYSPKRIKMQVFPGDDVDVSRGLASLLEFGLIRLYDSELGPVLHIVNWDKHQRISNPSRGRFTGVDLQERVSESTALASPLEDSVRKGREGKGSSSSSSAVATEDEPNPFDEFWSLYPRKVEKPSARKAWAAALKKASASEIIDGLREYPFGNDPKYVKHAATWLSKECWSDSPDNVRPIRPGDPHEGKVRMKELPSGRWTEVHPEDVLFGVHTEWRVPGT